MKKRIRDWDVEEIAKAICATYGVAISATIGIRSAPWVHPSGWLGWMAFGVALALIAVLITAGLIAFGRGAVSYAEQRNQRP